MMILVKCSHISLSFELSHLVIKKVNGRISFNDCGSKKEYSQLDICKSHAGGSVSDHDSLPLCTPLNQAQAGKG